jgi:hypothetical protein
MPLYRFLFMALVLSLSLAWGQAPPPDLPVKLELTLEGKPRRIEKAPWTIGHGELLVKSGSADRVMAGDRPVGVFFTGEATFRYTSVHTPEFPVLRYNLEQNKSRIFKPTLKKGPRWEESPGSIGFTSELQEGLVLGMPATALEGMPPADSLQAAFAAHRKRFQLEFQPQNAAPYYHDKEHLLAYASRNAPGQPAVIAELATGANALLYRFDPAWGKAEALDYVCSRYYEGVEYQFFEPLSFQPLGWTLQAPTLPSFILQDVNLRLEAPNQSQARLQVEETIMPFQPLRFLGLKMLTYLRRGDQKRLVKVLSVQDAAGKQLSFSHQNDQLLVDLGATMPSDRPVKLTFAIEGQMLLNADNFSFWSLGVEPWFPQPDWDGQFYTLRATLRVHKPYVPLASGTTVRRVVDGEFNVLEVVITKPTEYFTVFGGAYQLSEETRGTQTVRVASYTSMGHAAQKLTNLAFGIIEQYAPLLGPFPFKEFNIIQDMSLGYGQAPPGIMIITDEAFSGQMDDLAKLFTQGINQRFAHEIAHQYWGHAVKAPSWEEEWLQESFAEYCSAEALRAIRGKGKDAFEGAVATWTANAQYASSVAPIPLANRIGLMDDWRQQMRMRTSLLYGKGPLLLEKIRKRVGDPAFYRFLRLVQANFQDRFATTEEVRQLLEAVTKEDFKPFFNRHYWGTEMPPK